MITELRKRGYRVMAEPGRRVVQEEMKHGGRALPWMDMAAFLRRVIDFARADWAACHPGDEWVFFDRGLVDAAANLEYLTGEKGRLEQGHDRHYHRQVFFTPPWPEIYRQDEERRHDFTTAQAEYALLVNAYARLGYEINEAPKAPVTERVDVVLAALAGGA